MTAASAESVAILSVRGLKHRYSGVLAIDGIDLAIPAGSFTAILGPNGAGKSTLARILAGMLPPTRGTLYCDGKPVVPEADGVGLVGQGIALVPEGRRLFGQMSVLENLMLGAYGATRAEKQRRLERVTPLMTPAIQSGRNRPAASFSGGEQQMLALGRALMAAPRMLIVDEPSLGLAPILTQKVYATLAAMAAEGITILVLEQLATNAIVHAGHFVVLNRGRVIRHGTSEDRGIAEAIRIGYLGQE